MKININKSYNFNFLLWNLSIENFNTKVVIPNSFLGFFNYNSDKICIFIGKWLLTLTK